MKHQVEHNPKATNMKNRYEIRAHTVGQPVGEIIATTNTIREALDLATEWTRKTDKTSEVYDRWLGRCTRWVYDRKQADYCERWRGIRQVKRERRALKTGIPAKPIWQD